MSAPFAGPPPLPFATADGAAQNAPSPFASVHEELARMSRPRKHYVRYFCTPEADRDMRQAPQGIRDFLRAYYHAKSADWKANRPYPLGSFTADNLAKLPRYYVMDLDKGMAETAALEMPTAAEVAACKWLSTAELNVYADEFDANGFQGGLQWYRCAVDPNCVRELQTYSGRAIDVPSLFAAGASDWGVYQFPGDFEKMQAVGCSRMLRAHVVENAGHWVQQEQPAATLEPILEFLSLPVTGAWTR
jgi:pimeloyl-ACP methyl ester carboxylesterase